MIHLRKLLQTEITDKGQTVFQPFIFAAAKELGKRGVIYMQFEAEGATGHIQVDLTNWEKAPFVPITDSPNSALIPLVKAFRNNPDDVEVVWNIGRGKIRMFIPENQFDDDHQKKIESLNSGHVGATQALNTLKIVEEAMWGKPSTPEQQTRDSKQFRKDLDGVLQRLKETRPHSDERKEATKKIQEGIMWLGLDLKRIGESPNPYPQSYNPDSPVIEKTADGLKL